MINFVDDQVGRLIQYAGGLKNCLTVFTSDHGEMLGDHNLFRKTWPYEASARIPFLMRAPQKWGYPKEITCESPVGIQDIMPTSFLETMRNNMVGRTRFKAWLPSLSLFR